MNKKITWLLVLALLLVGVTAVMADARDLDFGQNGNQEVFYGYTAGELVDLEWVNNKSYAECPGVTEGMAGWHFVHPSGQLVSMEVSFGPEEPHLVLVYPGDHTAEQRVGPPPGTVTGVYFETDLDATLEEAKATGIGGQDFFVLSHVCVPGDYEELTVTKDAHTSYTREHYWDIAKKVETENEEFVNGTPKIWLYIDGSGDETATWTVDVTYEGYVDSDFNVSGTIIIVNTGTLDAVITAVDDVLGGVEIDVDCDVTFPYTLEVGETLTCTYDEDGYFEGFNEVTVTTERDTYFADAEIVWGDPTTEINETVNVKDISDLFGEVDLGTVTAPNGDTFTYDKAFAWEDYGADGCGSFQYDNTATIVETGQYASATLKVNVQCYIFESAWAKGDPNDPFCDNGFSNWGWSNLIGPGTYEWPLWAGAAQCDTSKGTLVGSVDVEYDGDGNVIVTFNIDPGYLLGSTAVYADTAMFPNLRNGNPTVAPGQYYNASPFDGSQVYVIAHANVGIPDPDFGPQ